MIIPKVVAVVAVGMFAAASVFGGDGCCAKGGEKVAAKSGCEVSFANLNLTQDQETKLKAAAEECNKGGCSEESTAKMNQLAKEILTEQQYAMWKESGGCAAKGEKARS